MATVKDQSKIAVIWIDWYPYHTARFRALTEHRDLRGRLVGIELVGGAGVHQGFVFREKADESLPVTTLAPDSSWSDAGQRHLAIQVWRKLNAVQPDVVLVPGYYTAPGVAAALWCKWNGKRSVLMTESSASDHLRSRWKENIKSVLVRALFDRAVAGGKAHIRYLEALKFPLKHVARSYDVVDNEFFSRKVEELRRHANSVPFGLPAEYFLYVGRLASEKNAAGLLREYARYRKQGGAWSLVVAGDGPERPALEQLATRLGIRDRVHFAGHNTAAELIPYYCFAKCFVLPSTREPWGLVVNEAMAAGLPVIVSNRCGCAEDLVSEGVNGWTFDASIPGELASRMAAMGHLDNAELGAMNKASREIIASYSPERFADEVARIVAA